MPIFEFVCHDCRKEFELLIMGSDRPVCPHCESRDLSKQMSTFAHRSKNSAGSSSGGSGSAKCSGCAGGSCSTC